MGLDRASVFVVAAAAIAAILLAHRGLNAKTASPSRWRPSALRPYHLATEPLLVADEISDAEAPVWPSTDDEPFNVEIARTALPIPPR